MATTASDSQPDFQQELLAIREDPEVTRLALRRAKNPEAAEDALQAAYCAVLPVANRGVVKDLRAYYCRVLINEIYREHGQLRATLLEDFTSLVDTRQSQPGNSSPARRPLTEEVQTRLLGQGWLGAFTQWRKLAARVPRRSPDPPRYQRLIVKAAEHRLRTILRENADADVNAVLRGGYAEWFAAPSSSENTRHQRLLRARADVCALLRTIIERGDLIS